jgi:hypothetical protein
LQAGPTDAVQKRFRLKGLCRLREGYLMSVYPRIFAANGVLSAAPDRGFERHRIEFAQSSLM